MLQGRDLNWLASCKYLFFFSYDLTYVLDIDWVTNAFIKQFNGLYCKHNYLERETLAHRFRTYTSSFWGIESWFYNMKKKSLFKISVAYNKAVKKIYFLKVWDSNHLACCSARVNIFCHMYAKRMITHNLSFFKSDSPCMYYLKYYFRYSSCIYRILCKYFLCNYDVHDVADNSLCALKARIDFVQRNEPRLTDMWILCIS